MEFKNFLLQFLGRSEHSSRVYICVARTYSSLVAYYLLYGIKKRYHVERLMFNETCSYADFERAAQTTFLGQTHILWLGNCSEYDVSLRKKLIAFMRSYDGPHTIIAFFDNDDYKFEDENVIVYDTGYNNETVTLFFELTWDKVVTSFVDHAKLSFEHAITLYMYTFFVSDSTVLVKAGWLDKIMKQDVSLFELSKLFFAKKKDPFFALWNRLSDEYPPVFWTVYWSEQLWHAFLVVHFREKKEFALAKQFQSKLPFSFLQYDWQKYTPEYLYEIHNMIVELDFRFKSNGTFDIIELVYYKFFYNQISF